MTLFARSFVVLLFAVIVSACAVSPNVYTDADPDQDFSVYNTFSWTSDNPLKVQGDEIISPLIEQRLMAAIKSTLQAKGYTYVDALDSADIAISFTVGARDKIRVIQEPTFAVNTGWRWGGQYWGLNVPLYQESTRVYSQGSLAIDVFDNSRKAPVWHGVSSKRLSSNEKQAEPEFVNQAVQTTLASFPSK